MIDSIRKNFVPELNQSIFENKLSRRKFLAESTILVASGAVTLGSVAKIVSDQLRYFPEFEIPYARDVEQIFGVKLKNDSTGKWESTSVLMLGQFLSKSPPLFSAATQNGELTYFMANNPIDCKCGAFYGKSDSGSDAILFQKDIFNSKDLVLAHDTFYHESSHKADYNQGNVSWGKVESIYSNKFSNIAANISNNLSEFKPQDSNEMLISLWGKLNYGISNPKSQKEFIATLGEIYSYGQSAFNLNSVWLGDNQTPKLYEVIKKDLYQGLEYKNLNDSIGELEFDNNGNPLKVEFLGINNSTK